MTGAAWQEGDGFGDGPPRPVGALATGPILRTLITFSISTLISNLLQTVIQSIGMIWVGRLLGEQALAATTNGIQLMSLVGTFLMGIAMATMISIGRHSGAGDGEGARSAFACGLGVAIGCGCGLGLGGYLLAGQVLHLLGTPRESMADAIAYLRVLFLMLPAAGLTSTLQMASRGSGDSRTSLYGTVVTLVVSAGLNPVLILGLGGLPKLGVAGAALTAGLANLAGVAAMAALLWRPASPLRLGREHLRLVLPRGPELRAILGNGLPISVHMNLVVFAQLVLIGLVNREGLNYTAAFGVSLQIWTYLQMPSFAISAGITAMAAQAIGAGDHARVGRITRTGMAVSTAMVAVLIGVILLFIRPILTLFLGPGSPAIALGQHMQAICIWAFILSSAMSAMTGTLRAYGAQMVTVAINLMALLGVRLAVYFATYPLIGADALWWSFIIGIATSLLLTRIVFVRGPWGKGDANAGPEQPLHPGRATLSSGQ